MIRVKNLNFEYDGKRVLHDISFEIKKGDITALVGPNGAGKSTLMRSIAGLEAPVSGQIFVSDIDVIDRPREAHEKMGYLSDFFGLYDDLTVEQHLKYFAGCYGLPTNGHKARINEVIELAGLEKYRHSRGSELSRGYRQRLGIAISIMHTPDILILDEPASGMDPEARVELSSLLMALRDQGMTLLVSSHILAELEDYCTSMLVIRDGRMAEHVHLDGTSKTKSTKSKAQNLIVEFEFDNTAKDVKTALGKIKSIVEFKTKGKFAVCEIKGTKKKLPDILKSLIKHDINVLSYAPVKQSLQAKYLELAKNIDAPKDGAKK